MWASLYMDGVGVLTITFEQRILASLTLIPVLIPSFFASIDGATTQPPGLSYATTTIGFPRSLGLACCSIVAKQEFRSTCIIRGSVVLIPSESLLISIRHLLKKPKKIFCVVAKSKIKTSCTYCKFM